MTKLLFCSLALLALVISAQEYQEDGDFERGIIAELSDDIDNSQVQPDCLEGQRSVKPHIVFFLVDDFGFHDISWNNPDVETPNLQGLADSGVILDRHYASPACSPSRGALHTGKYSHRIGMQHSVILSDTPEGLSSEHKILSEYLKEVGYANHILGKWHLGFCNEKYLPLNRGYDSFYGFYNSHIDHYTHTLDGMYDLWDDNTPDTTNNGSYTQTLLDARAAKIIAAHDPDTPLFLMMSSPLTHTPLQTAPDVPVESGWRSIFKSMIKSMDESVGKVIAELKQHGLYENSIFVFAADNGGMSNAYFSDNGPLRGAKGTIYEGGTRVPAMFHAHKLRDEVKGTVHQGMFHISDWMPTLLGFAGVCPEDIDGMNQHDMLMFGGDSRRTEMVYNVDQYQPYTFGQSAIRMGDYKMILGYPGKYDGWSHDRNIGFTHVVDHMGIGPGDAGGSDSRKKRSYTTMNYDDLLEYVQRAVDNVQLYNIMTDPEERENLADDAAYEATVEVMKARIDEYLQNAVELDLQLLLPSSAAKDPSFEGIWTTGWC